MSPSCPSCSGAKWKRLELEMSASDSPGEDRRSSSSSSSPSS